MIPERIIFVSRGITLVFGLNPVAWPRRLKASATCRGIALALVLHDLNTRRALFLLTTWRSPFNWGTPPSPQKIWMRARTLRAQAILHLAASSPLCYKQSGRVCGTSKQNCLVSYLLCWRRHVSATVDHLQVTKMFMEENYTEYDHSIDAYSTLSERSRCQLDCTYWADSIPSKYSIKIWWIYIYISSNIKLIPSLANGALIRL